MTDSLHVLAFGAHPDDVELMCGGTMIKLIRMGYHVGIISITAGELGTRGSAKIRAEEFAESARIMQLSMNKSLDIADGDIHVNLENKLKVIHEMRAYRPNLIFAPYWQTRHPDHANCSRLVSECAYFSGLKKISTGQEPFRPKKVVYYMEHYEVEPSFIVDVTETFAVRMQAIQAYQSQVFRGAVTEKDEDETYISSQQYFQSLNDRAKYWGGKIGMTYGEPFYIREHINLPDPYSALM